MKTDIPGLPSKVPHKRKTVEKILDVHIAMWLEEDSGITPSERRMLTEEKARRRADRLRTGHATVGLVCCDAGATKEQLEKVRELVAAHNPDTVKANKTLKLGLRIRYDIVRDVREEIIKECDLVICMPKEMSVKTYATPGVWSDIGYALNRSMPVQIVLPDGKLDSRI